MSFIAFNVYVSCLCIIITYLLTYLLTYLRHTTVTFTNVFLASTFAAWSNKLYFIVLYSVILYVWRITAKVISRFH